MPPLSDWVGWALGTELVVFYTVLGGWVCGHDVHVHVHVYVCMH